MAGEKKPKNPPPVLISGAHSIIEAFWELDTERQTGWTVGQIPFRAIESYADKYGIIGLDAFDSFRVMIRAMDEVYLKKHAPKNPNDKTAGSALPPISVAEIAAIHQKSKHQ